MGIIETISGKKIYLDTNIFIYAVEAISPWNNTVEQIFTTLDKGDSFGFTSALTYAECLVEPLRSQRGDIAQIYLDFLQSDAFLTVASIEQEIIIKAAQIRAENKSIKLPDAIHAATAIIYSCDYFITNDQRFQNLSSIKTILLKELI